MNEHQQTTSTRLDWIALWRRLPEWLQVTATIAAYWLGFRLFKFAPQPLQDSLFWALILAALLHSVVKKYFASPKQTLVREAEENAKLDEREGFTLYDCVVLGGFFVMVAALMLFVFWLALPA
jgi:hypothetical protein